MKLRFFRPFTTTSVGHTRSLSVTSFESWYDPCLWRHPDNNNRWKLTLWWVTYKFSRNPGTHTQRKQTQCPNTQETHTNITLWTRPWERTTNLVWKRMCGSCAYRSRLSASERRFPLTHLALPHRVLACWLSYPTLKQKSYLWAPLAQCTPESLNPRIYTQ